jgi:hypothetical protein
MSMPMRASRATVYQFEKDKPLTPITTPARYGTLLRHRLYEAFLCVTIIGSAAIVGYEWVLKPLHLLQ